MPSRLSPRALVAACAGLLLIAVIPAYAAVHHHSSKGIASLLGTATVGAVWLLLLFALVRGHAAGGDSERSRALVVAAAAALLVVMAAGDTIYLLADKQAYFAPLPLIGGALVSWVASMTRPARGVGR